MPVQRVEVGRGGGAGIGWMSRISADTRAAGTIGTRTWLPCAACCVCCSATEAAVSTVTVARPSSRISGASETVSFWMRARGMVRPTRVSRP